MLESLDIEVQELADQRHDELLLLLLDNLKSKPGKVEAALSRYVSLKLALHRLKRRINGNSFEIWSGTGEKNDDALSKAYNAMHVKVKEARSEYYGIKNW
ncbi:MAG TPA: hypothetical protein VM577_09445 [Anaerovoracaceae bacterium]|nr:hypothetical protein [Anaerovoracaceae bacterium]